MPEPVDIVDIFRRSEYVPEIVEAAIRKGAKTIWMQESVVHEPAAAHQRATVHARVPSASVAQQPVEQSALVLHRGLQTCPAPGSEAHAVGAPFTAQH